MVIGSPSCRLAQKLKLLKKDLRGWNMEVFGRLESQKATVVSLLQALDELEVNGGLSLADVSRKRQPDRIMSVSLVRKRCVSGRNPFVCG